MLRIVAIVTNTVLTPDATYPMPVVAPKAIIPMAREYSTRSWPSSRSTRWTYKPADQWVHMLLLWESQVDPIGAGESGKYNYRFVGMTLATAGVITEVGQGLSPTRRTNGRGQSYPYPGDPVHIPDEQYAFPYSTQRL